jgi:hypothetical protein
MTHLTELLILASSIPLGVIVSIPIAKWGKK